MLYRNNMVVSGIRHDGPIQFDPSAAKLKAWRQKPNLCFWTIRYEIPTLDPAPAHLNQREESSPSIIPPMLDLQSLGNHKTDDDAKQPANPQKRGAGSRRCGVMSFSLDGEFALVSKRGARNRFQRWCRSFFKMGGYGGGKPDWENEVLGWIGIFFVTLI